MVFGHRENIGAFTDKHIAGCIDEGVVLHLEIAKFALSSKHGNLLGHGWTPRERSRSAPTRIYSNQKRFRFYHRVRCETSFRLNSISFFVC